MSEVIRYLASHTPYEGLDLNGQCARHDGDYFVSASDFDRVTAERDAALGREAAITRRESLFKEKLADCESALVDAQQRLTAADELNDNRDSEIFAQVQSALRRSFSLGQIYWQQADSDSTCQQNKSDQTMEVQEQHILNVLKSLGAALKPAECNDSCEFCNGWVFRANPDGADEGCGACNGTGKEPSDEQ